MRKIFTQAPTIVSKLKAMQLGSFTHLSIEKTTVITRVDRTFLRVDLREDTNWVSNISSDQTLPLRARGKGVLLKFLNNKSSK